MVNLKNISKASIKKRTLLILNYLAETTLIANIPEIDLKPSITEEEYNKLVDSIKSNEEIRQYEHHRKDFWALFELMQYLVTIRTICLLSIEKLDHLLTIRRNNLDLEDLANLLLEKITEDKKQEAIQTIRDFHSFSRGCRSFEEKDNLVSVKQNNIEKHIEIERQDALSLLSKLKTGLELSKQKSKEKKLNVRVFDEAIAVLIRWIQDPRGKGPRFFCSETHQKMYKNHKGLYDKYTLKFDYDSLKLDKDFEKYLLSVFWVGL